MLARPYFSPDRLTLGAAALVALLSQPVPVLAQARVAATPPATAAPSAASSLGGAARWADSVRLLAERGYLSGDTTLLAAGYRLAQRSLTAFPDDPLLLHYQGYIRYRQAQQQRDFDVALPLFEESEYETKNWAVNEMNWCELKEHAFRRDDVPVVVDFEQEWCNNEKEIVEW